MPNPIPRRSSGISRSTTQPAAINEALEPKVAGLVSRARSLDILPKGSRCASGPPPARRKFEPPFVASTTTPLTAAPSSKHEHFDLSTLQTKEKIRSGAYGAIYKSSIILNGKEIPCAIKKPLKEKNKLSAEQRLEARHEAAILGSLKHPYIVKMYAFDEEESTMVMELADASNMYDLFSKINNLDDNELAKKEGAIIKKSLTKQLISAVRYMADEGVAHHEIHLGNILYNQQGSIRIADFGKSSRVPAGEYSVSNPHADYVGSHTNCFKPLKNWLDDFSCIPEEDANLIEELTAFVKEEVDCKLYQTKFSKEKQIRIREALHQLDMNTENWNCLSEEEIASRLNPLCTAESTHADPPLEATHNEPLKMVFSEALSLYLKDKY
jgi:Protein kinase domain